MTEGSNRSSMESLMGENPNKYNKKNKKRNVLEEKNEEEDFIKRIVKPMQAKSK